MGDITNFVKGRQRRAAQRARRRDEALRGGVFRDEPGCVHAAPKGLDYHAYHNAVRAAGNRCSRPPKALKKF